MGGKGKQTERQRCDTKNPPPPCCCRWEPKTCAAPPGLVNSSSLPRAYALGYIIPRLRRWGVDCSFLKPVLAILIPERVDQSNYIRHSVTDNRD